MVVGKHVYQGRSAELAAKSEIIARGYNVADWEVEVGADFLVTLRNSPLVMRVEVKSNRAHWHKRTGQWRTHFKIRRSLVADSEGPELYFIFAARVESRWEYVIISRRELARLYPLPARGRTPSRFLALKFHFTPTAVRGPAEHNYERFRNNWTRYWPTQADCG